MKKNILHVVLFVAFLALGAAATSTGWYIRPDCGVISGPGTNATICLQSTTVSGRSAGGLYYWNGSAWTLIIGSGSAAPGGSDTQVQYNDGGVIAGDSGLTWNETTNVLTATGGFVGPLTGAVTGNVTGNLTGAVTGNASTATGLATNGTLAGTVTGTYTLAGAPTIQPSSAADFTTIAGNNPTGSQPRTKLGIIGTDDRVLQLYNNDSTALAIAIFGGFRSGGTFESPTAVVADRVISCHGSYPYESVTGSYQPHSGLACFHTSEAITDVARGTGYFIATTAKGSTGMLSKLWVSPNGPVDIKSQSVPFADYTPPGYLNVDAGTMTSTTAKPVFNSLATWQSGATVFTGIKLAITNTASAAASLLMDLQLGAVSQFSVSKDGLLRTMLYGSNTNCSSSAEPAVCSAAPAGSVVVAAGATTVTVNTTAVTANSQIFVQEDSSLGTKLSVTCNTTTGRNYTVTARTAGTSFVITSAAGPTTNPACLSYFIVN